MSAWVVCEKCGQMKEVPAYEGDGVYSEHTCPRSFELIHYDSEDYPPNDKDT